jgi:formate-dependent nitrite reductase membrane component NrfD
VEVGLAPPCVNVCPEHAIIAGDMDDTTTEISQMLARHQTQVRKPEKGTQPNVFYIEGDTASLNPTYTETPQGYLWSEIPKRVYQIAPPRLEQAESEARRVYDQGQSHVDSWGGKVAAYLWTKSIAAGIPLAIWISQLISGENQFSLLLNLISILFLAITTVLLIIDLKQPKRFHWIIFRPQWKSWVARGAFILMGFGIFLALDLFFTSIYPSDSLFLISFYLTLVFAVGSAIYSAFLFWQAKGRDLWQSPLFAVHLIVMALLAGAGVVVIVNDTLTGVGGILFVALFLHAGLILLDLMAVHSTQDAKIAARSMHHKNWLFWIGAIVFGIVAPLFLLYFGLLGPAGLVALIGLLIYERVWIRAGQIVPLS